jgi:ubiquitin conjugation factor E4 B
VSLPRLHGIYTDVALSLPLKAEMPEAFRFLPEYVLEDIVGNFNFIFRYEFF